MTCINWLWGFPKSNFHSFVIGIFDWPITKKKKSSFGEYLNKYIIISKVHKGYKSRTQDKLYEIKWALTVIALCSWICKEHFWLNMLKIPVVTLIRWNQIAYRFKPPPKCWNPTTQIITKAPKKGGKQGKKREGTTSKDTNELPKMMDHKGNIKFPSSHKKHIK